MPRCNPEGVHSSFSHPSVSIFPVSRSRPTQNLKPLNIRSASISFRGGLSTGELGSTWGYLYAFLQLIGFSFGSLIVFAGLSNIPYCEKCSKYLTQTNTQKRYTSHADNLSEKIQTFAKLLHERQYVFKNQVVLQVSMCWKCDNMYVWEENGRSLYGLNLEQLPAKRLLALLEKVMK